MWKQAKQLNGERLGEVDMSDVISGWVIGFKLTSIVVLVVSVRSPRPAVLTVQHYHCVRVNVWRRALNLQSSYTIQRAQVDL